MKSKSVSLNAKVNGREKTGGYCAHAMEMKENLDAAVKRNHSHWLLQSPYSGAGIPRHSNIFAIPSP